MSWKDIVGSVAPVLGTALGGPFGGMAGKWLAGQLGVDETDLETTVMNADPDAMLKIKQLEVDFKTKMKELEISEEQLHAGDRDSARQMAANTSMVPQLVLSVLYTTAYAVVLWAFVSGKVQVVAESQAQFSIILGVLTAAQAQILNFWFGSSSGSKEKTAAMKKGTP